MHELSCVNLLFGNFCNILSHTLLGLSRWGRGPKIGTPEKQMEINRKLLAAASGVNVLKGRQRQPPAAAANLFQSMRERN